MIDDSVKNYVDGRIEEAVRLRDAIIEGIERHSKAQWDAHYKYHDTVEKAHAQLHEVHEESHRREHGYTEEALAKAERQTVARIEEFDTFKERVQIQTQNHITETNLKTTLENYVTTKEFSTVRSLVYGAVAMVLTSFLGALAAIVTAQSGGF